METGPKTAQEIVEDIVAICNSFYPTPTREGRIQQRMVADNLARAFEDLYAYFPNSIPSWVDNSVAFMLRLLQKAYSMNRPGKVGAPEMGSLFTKYRATKVLVGDAIPDQLFENILNILCPRLVRCMTYHESINHLASLKDRKKIIGYLDDAADFVHNLIDFCKTNDAYGHYVYALAQKLTPYLETLKAMKRPGT